MSIQIQGLTKVFGTQTAVNNISFDIPSGTIVGFLGPNGAGKSTTMKMLTTYIPPTSGTAKIYGLDIVKDAMEVRKNVGYLAESNPLYYDMYVREYLEIVAGVYNLGAVKNSRIDAVIEMTGLQKEVKKKIGNLSKGYKQRVGLAQAMIHDPKVLILDEPTSGLDPNQLMDIRELIIKIGRDKTILLSTHIMQEVEAMCERVVIINNGKVVADDTLQNVQMIKNDEAAMHLITVEFSAEPQLGSLDKSHVLDIKQISQNTFEFYTHQPNDLRKLLMHWSVNNDIDIINIISNQASLESTFRELTK